MCLIQQCVFKAQTNFWRKPFCNSVSSFFKCYNNKECTALLTKINKHLF